ncbi:3-hydroxyacyl-CoA dehydrogenase NAD-binding domain-containing protein [Saccharopolyspora dendranthemae]|uniref:Ketoreductase RED1 n=1 Tax=Saccharopolyspora dendranthemae TaxID=1181886 RepID=A0A561U384_9PSEU|nr:3-hydroxyacyl-CoA dehydrogenase NAD-binding domain-containing protein [Saccharopolyspora dendranthemae]TWF93816.1 ketoreductase RED1 [Saccharopolyspora dendranthemae]
MRTEWTNVAVVGAGTIGLAWAALFAHAGLEVRVTDPREDLDEAIDDALPMLADSMPGAQVASLRERISATDDLAKAVENAQLVQENGPERLEFKQRLFAEIARHAPADAVLASSSSGIVASAIAAELPEDVAARLLIAHPFNPPQVVPLVEIVPGTTEEEVVQRTIGFYRDLGKTPVRVHKEVPGFVANRLQSAVMRESVSLVQQGVVSAAELDTVMKASLGGRYATIGPFESFHLGGGPGGIRHMMAHLGVGMADRWAELGRPELDESTTTSLVEQTEAAYGSGPDAYRARARIRDRKHNAINAALFGIDTGADDTV